MNSPVNVTWEWLDLTTEEELRASVTDIVHSATESDGIEPLSEQFVLGLSDARLNHRHLLGRAEGTPIAVAAVAGDEAEYVVTPEYRRRGVGTAVYRELAESVDKLKVWAHGNTPGARAIAQNHNLTQVRRLLVLDIQGEALEKSAHFEAPEGFTALTLAESRARWNAQDVERAWLTANNEAFSWHPEQGGWDMPRLQRAMETEWFSADDVWFLWDSGAESTELPPLAGFHWTKKHDAETAEVYVVGLADAYRGQGLGGPAVSMGLQHMYSEGARRVLLYVEDDNTAAVERYKKDGFELAEEHVVYSAT